MAGNTIITDINRRSEIKEILSFKLPPYKILRASSDGNIWDYTSYYVIEFSEQLTPDDVRVFKKNMTEIQEDYLFKITNEISERDKGHLYRIIKYLGLADSYYSESKVRFECALTYYGEIKQQLNPEKFIKFGFNTSTNTAVIKIIHM